MPNSWVGIIYIVFFLFSFLDIHTSMFHFSICRPINQSTNLSIVLSITFSIETTCNLLLYPFVFSLGVAQITQLKLVDNSIEE